MKTKTTYVCEYCESEFNSQTECAICERSHANITGIKRATYRKGFKFPPRIWIQFSDGYEGKCIEYTIADKK